MIDSDGNLKDYDQWVKDTASINAHYNKAWLRTEYDTAVLRAQMAADWKQFEADADVLPNLKWMPTTSVTPREQHRVFWSEGLTLPIDDPFWNKHRPGDLWNCKCWLEQTDEPATAKKDLPKESEMPSPMPGLEGNPAKTEEIFSQDHPHFPTSCASCLLNTDGKVHGLKGVKNASQVIKGDCLRCDIKDSCLARLEGFTDKTNQLSKEEYEQRKNKYEILKKDDDYVNVTFDAKSGALKATHVKHNFNGGKGWYEKHVQDVGFKNGASVILEEEDHSQFKKRHVEGTWNGLKFEIAGKETATAQNIREGLKHCAKKKGCKIAVLYFPNNNFNCRAFYSGLVMYNGLSGTSQWTRFDKIICIQGDDIIYEKSHL